MRAQTGGVRLPLVFGVATALGIFSTFQAYNYVSFFTESRPSFPLLLGLNVTYWYAWAVLVPGILWLARRYRFGRHTWLHASGVHAVGVLVFTSLHAALAVSAHLPIANYFGREMTWWPGFQELFFRNFDWEMMTYWAVVGVSHAVDFHRESQEQQVAAAHLETRLAEARLQTLQAQLHPHFLFNTLHSISALMHRDTEAADAMLARLSDLLRLSLERTGTQHVTLKDELDFLAKYLEIEQARFGDRLRIRTDVDPEVLDASVPHLLLQPLVENAVRHGIAKKIEGGLLELQARRQNRELELLVRDSGPGLPAAALSALNTGVGLANTRSRLQELYPGRHRFEFERPPEGGLAVRIVIPFASQPGMEPGVAMESVA